MLALFQTVTDALVHGDRVQGDTRSAPRRRHDALLAVLRHAADCPGQALPTQGGNRAQVTIIATAATLTGLTGAQPASLVGTGHGLLTQPEFRRLLCDADISTIWLNPTTERLELSRSTPTVNRHQFRVLTTRDRHCVVTGCHRRPTQCQAHHVVHWANGGPSDVDNLVLLCHAHHHDIHDRHRWLPCTNNRVMTPAGWLDPTTASTTDRDPPR